MRSVLTGRRLLVSGLVVVFALSLLARCWHLERPREYMFDEVYYAKDAATILQGSVGPEAAALRWEPGEEVSWAHPEMGKFAVALGIVVAGDRSLGWRLPSVVAGMLTLILVYPIARRLGLRRLWAFLAFVFAAADLLGIAQSRIATLDVFVGLWTVLCIYLALRYADQPRPSWLWLTGLAGGMAVGTKWSGLLALVAAVIVIVWKRWPRPARAGASPAGAVRAWGSRAVAPAGTESVATACAGASQTDAAAPSPTLPVAPLPETPSGSAHRRGAALHVAGTLVFAVAALVVLPALVYLLSYAQYFLSGHTWADFVELHRQMWHFNTTLSAPHSYASKASTWIFDKRPVWYYFNSRKEIYTGVVAMGNPFLWWTAAAAVVGVPLTCAVRRTGQGLLPLLLVLVLYLPWFATSRTSFLYYMTPVAPFMAILVAQWMALLLQPADAGGVAVDQREGQGGAGAPTLAAPPIGWRQASAWVVAWVLGFGLAGFGTYRIGRTAELLLPQMPSYLGRAAGVALVVVIVGAVLAAVIAFAGPRLTAVTGWLLWAWAGAVTGIALVFLRIVLANPVPADQFYRLMWFRSWI